MDLLNHFKKVDTKPVSDLVTYRKGWYRCRLDIGMVMLFAGAMMVTLILLSVLPVQASSANGQSHAVGRILVQPQSGLPEQALEKIIAHAGGQVQEKLSAINLHVVRVPEQAEARVAKALAANPHIRFAEPDMVVELESVTANDPYFANAWHLPLMGAPEAWLTTRGDAVLVAILDTGVDLDHPDLVSRVQAGWNSTLAGGDSLDINGHGTMVAGVVAAEADNLQGVASIAPHALIMPVRVTNAADGWAYWSDIARGLTWAADNGARVANISYDVSSSASVSSAARYMKSKGGMVVVAAGNSGADPGYSENVDLLSVSATTSSELKASWSSFGYYVDLAAPGASIWTTKNGGGYGAASGTSFASPATAAVVALVMAANDTLGPDDVEQILKATAIDLGDAGWDANYGYGRVDARAAVDLAIATIPVADTVPPVAVIVSPSAGSTVSGVTSVSVTASDDAAVSRVELYVNDTLLGSDQAAPWEFSWDTTALVNGGAALLAKAYDNAGNSGISPAVAVVVDNGVPEAPDSDAPLVTIMSPSEGATVSGNVAIDVQAYDDRQLATVTVLVDDIVRCVGNATTMSCMWNTRKAEPGIHWIKAVAEDGAGNVAATEISVFVGATVKGSGKEAPGKGKKK